MTTTLVYSNNGRAYATHSEAIRKLAGTKHRGSEWTRSVQVLRPAIHNALEHAGWRQSATAEDVGIDIIDRIHELDDRGINVLQFAFAVLVRAARNSN